MSSGLVGALTQCFVTVAILGLTFYIITLSSTFYCVRLFVLLACFSPLLKTVPSTCICGVYELHMFTLSFAPTLPSVSLNRESSV